MASRTAGSSVRRNSRKRSRSVSRSVGIGPSVLPAGVGHPGPRVRAEVFDAVLSGG